MKNTIDRARAYVAKMPFSVSGQGGHAAAFAVAVTLTRGFNLTEHEALPLMLEWNADCLPPWSESELRHKLRNAATSFSKPAGYLLGEIDTPHRERTAPDFENKAEQKARQRKAWPVLKVPTWAERKSISHLRNLPSEEAVTIAARGGEAGVLRVCQFEGHACFIIAEGTFAQARRLDGGMLDTSKGPSKTKNFLGSEGAFVGHAFLHDNAAPVLLVEGCIGLLEAFEARALAGAYEWTCIAATSAGSRFARDPELLAKLKGRRVRIVPDAGTAGRKAARVWLGELRAAGAIVDAHPLPGGCKDLGPVVATADTFREPLTSLFTL